MRGKLAVSSVAASEAAGSGGTAIGVIVLAYGGTGLPVAAQESAGREDSPTSDAHVGPWVAFNVLSLRCRGVFLQPWHVVRLK